MLGVDQNVPIVAAVQTGQVRCRLGDARATFSVVDLQTQQVVRLGQAGMASESGPIRRKLNPLAQIAFEVKRRALALVSEGAAVLLESANDPTTAGIARDEAAV